MLHLLSFLSKDTTLQNRIFPNSPLQYQQKCHFQKCYQSTTILGMAHLTHWTHRNYLPNFTTTISTKASFPAMQQCNCCSWHDPFNTKQENTLVYISLAMSQWRNWMIHCPNLIYKIAPICNDCSTHSLLICCKDLP